MKTNYFISTSNNPFYNLAFEEWLVKNYDSSQGDFLLLYVNAPSVVVGRNQNVFEEVNIPYCNSKDIMVSRRVSGGGTVFHDFGNLNWTFITKYDSKKVNNYTYFAKPIIAVLKEIGFDAATDSRNAIRIGDMKISGQAQFTNKTNVLSHGTLLVNSDLNKLQPAIHPIKQMIIESKASKSVRSVTQNICDLGNRQIAIEEITSLLIAALDAVRWNLNEEIEKQILYLQEKYESSEWVFGKSPKSIVRGGFEIQGSTQYLQLKVVKGRVEEVKNEKGTTLQQHLFLNQSYEKILTNYSLYTVPPDSIKWS